MERQNLSRSTATLSAGTLIRGPLAALLNGIEPPPTPTRVSATDIDQVRIATQAFQSWSRAYGGGVAQDAVMGKLRWSACWMPPIQTN